MMSIKFLRPDLWWLFILLLFAFLALLRLSYIPLKLSTIEKRILLILRGTVVLILLLVLLQPVLDAVTFKSVKPGLAVLADSSLSMQMAESGGENAFLKRMTEQLRKNGFSKWEKDYEVRTYSFSDKVRPVKSLDDVKPQHGQTDLKRTLLNFFGTFAENDIRGILILSDGQFEMDAGLNEVVKKYKENGIGLLPVFPKEAKSVQDVAIRFAEGNPTELIADQENNFALELRNASDLSVKILVELYDNDLLVRSRNLQMGFGQRKENFSYRISQEGVHRLKVRIRADKGDMFDKNNEDHLFVRVEKGGQKVLLLYGALSWEYKFLVRLLSSDPTISLTALPRVHEDDFAMLEKIPLGNYDAVILGNIAKADMKPAFLASLARRVQSSGLSLLVMGGERSFLSEQGLDPAFQSVLPVELNGRFANITEPTAISLTREGEASAVTLLADNPAANKLAWEKLPQLNFINAVPARSDATVLLVSAKDRNFPVLAYRQSGMGKVFVFTGYPTWKWAFMNLAVNDDQKKYQAFYRQLVREMTSSALEKTKLSTDKFLYQPGESVRVSAVLLDSQSKPSASGTARVSIEYKGKRKGELLLKNSSLTRERFTGEMHVEDEGEYRLRLDFAGEKLETAFVVRESADEYFSLGPQRANMARIATLAGTELVDPAQIPDITRYADTGKKTRKFSTRLPLWNWFPVVVILIVLLTAEWIIRKRRGLL